VRALAHARRPAARLRQRAPRAGAESTARHARQPGTQRLAAEADAWQVADARIAHHRGAAVRPSGVHPPGHAATQRRSGQRPARPRRTTRGQVEARREQAAMAPAVRRRGWRVYATHPAQETMGLTPVGAASRRAYLVAPGMRRLTGRAWSRTPRSWPYAPRLVGLLFLRSMARRGLGLMQWVARAPWKTAGPTRQGLSPGHPGRHTTRPPTERRLHVLRGITWSRMTVHDETDEHVTPRTAVPEGILELLGLSAHSFSRRVPQWSKADFYSHEP